MPKLAFSMALLHPLSVVAGVSLGGPWLLSTIVLSVIVYPAVELAWAHRAGEPTSSERGDGNVEGAFAAAILYGVAFIQLGLVAWLVCFGFGQLSGAAFVVVCYSIGLCSGTNGITIAHELMHRRGRLASGLSWALLLATSYPWFRLQHLRKHHQLVASDADPATARYGQSVYSFYRQSIGGAFADLFKSTSGLAPRRCLAAMVALYSLLGALFGAWSVVAFCLQGVVGIFVLETINYIQHYGLLRKPGARRIGPELSWDTSSITNYALFNLGLHSNHHSHPGRRFSSLSLPAGSPRMPFGYFTMALIALSPWLWRKLMDHRIPARAIAGST
jgi:alkane 1-monooxygenase